MHPPFSDPLHRIVYMLVCAENDLVQRVVLGRNGQVRGNSVHERRRYRFDGQQLVFIDGFGRDTARLNYDVESKRFNAADCHGVHLIPLLDLGPANLAIHDCGLLVNTVPKSGTYLLDLMLSELGFNGLGLHLLSLECHDNRKIDPSEFHRAPYSRRIFAPPGIVAQAMMPGEYAVGHIFDLDQAKSVAQAGVKLINCVRNLRNVVVSFFRHKLKSVDPTDASDQLWRSLPDPERLVGYLIYAGSIELRDIGVFCRLINEFPGVTLRFENLCAGVIPPSDIELLNRYQPNLGVMLAEILPSCLGRETSTLSNRPSEWEQYWSPEAEKFFEASGLLEVNRLLGYQ